MNKACISCEVKNYFKCDAEQHINSMAKEKDIDPQFVYCVFNRVAKKLKLAVMRDILEDEN